MSGVMTFNVTDNLSFSHLLSTFNKWLFKTVIVIHCHTIQNSHLLWDEGTGSTKMQTYFQVLGLIPGILSV